MVESSPNELAFEAALQNSGNINIFLDDFFNFLSRRTDFFIECPKEGGPFGFIEGHAEKLLISKFHKWKQIHNESKKNISLEKMSEKIKIKESKNVKSRSQLTTSSTTSSASVSSDTYNGSTTDKYSWSQTITDLDVRIPVSSEIKKGKDVTVVIQNDSLIIKISTAELISGEFEFLILKEDSYWNLIPGEAIHIWLQKKEERWWKMLLKGSIPIEMNSIEAIKPMEDLSDTEHMKIEEMVWKEDQKRKGIAPVPKEMEILKQAWNVEGSPFQGQPFDPSLVNFGST